ncbi:MAG: hypothetical protein FWD36_09225 [Treponema sp.]|nr:hypothetical protein [Treponema sp.]
MRINAVSKAAGILLLFSLFTACGELDTLLPSNGSYQVKTLVNGLSLEDCSIIRADDQIRPYFAVSVVNDPDLIGLLVYIQNAQGKVVGEKVRYILPLYADETAPAEPEKTDETNNETAEETAPETRIAANTDIEFIVYSLAHELPFLPLPKNLNTGQYTLVFEALGKKKTLAYTETDIYYLGNTTFNLKDIAMFLPGISGSRLIPPGTTVMLQANLDFDSRLDPYVIWYNGKTIVSQGNISDGAGTIMWKVPEQAGFYSLRIEASPFRLRRTISGITREIILPVSPKAASTSYFFNNAHQNTTLSPSVTGTAYQELLAMIADSEDTDSPVMPSAPELLRWYQFKGDLRDSTDVTLTDERSLTPNNAIAPQWAIAGQSYGLSVGPNDVYTLPSVNFFPAAQYKGGGIFLLHILPAEGIMFSAFFPSIHSSTEGAWVSVSKEENAIVLHLSAGETTTSVPVYLPHIQGFIPVVVEVFIQPYEEETPYGHGTGYRLEAKLSLDEDPSLQSKTESISLPGALTGEAIVRLGAAAEFPIIERTIWNEFAVLLSTVPLIPAETAEEPAEEETVSDTNVPPESDIESPVEEHHSAESDDAETENIETNQVMTP